MTADRDFVARGDIVRALEALEPTIQVARDAMEAKILVQGALSILEELRQDLKATDADIRRLEEALQQIRENLRILDSRLEGSTRQIEGLTAAQAQGKAQETALQGTRITSSYTFWGIVIPSILALLGTLIGLVYQSNQKEKGGEKGVETMDWIAGAPGDVDRPASQGLSRRL